MLIAEIKQIINEMDRKEFRKFGITIGSFLAVIGLIFYFLSSNNASVMILIGVALLVSALSFPIVLKPFFIIWMSFAAVMGYVMTRLILGILFYLIFTPIGLILKLFRKRLLELNIDPAAASYWKMREPEPYTPERTEKQY